MISIYTDEERAQFARELDAATEKLSGGDAEFTRPARILARRGNAHGVVTDSELLEAQVLIDLVAAKALKRIAEALEADRG